MYDFSLSFNRLSVNESLAQASYSLFFVKSSCHHETEKRDLVFPAASRRDELSFID